MLEKLGKGGCGRVNARDGDKAGRKDRMAWPLGVLVILVLSATLWIAIGTMALLADRL
jgi:hypothetical protein